MVDEAKDGWEGSETDSTVVTSGRWEVRRLIREVVSTMAVEEEGASRWPGRD